MDPLVKRILQLIFLVFLQALLLFLSAGDLSWVSGWLYIGLYTGCLLVSSILLLPGHRDVIEERSRGTAGGKPWDILLTRLLAVTSLASLVVAGLHQRFRWGMIISPLWQAAGVVFFLLGFALVIWAMHANRFFSTVVRI